MMRKQQRQSTAVRLGLAAFLFGCCMTAWADEPPEQQQEIRTLTVAQARAALAGGFNNPDIVSMLQASDSDYELQQQTARIVVVHAEEIEPLAFKALSSKYVVIYRHLKSIDAECQQVLDKDKIRPSFPALESITPNFALRLSRCKDSGIHSRHGMKVPLHLCGLASIDERSLVALQGIPVCLCGLTELTARHASVLARRVPSDGVLLSKKTKVKQDAWSVLHEHVRIEEHDNRGGLARQFHLGDAFWVHPPIRIISERCKHREIAFATPNQFQERQPKPDELLPPNPFEVE